MEPATTLESYLGGLRAAGESTRIRLLALCAGGDLTVSELVRILGQSQPRVSRHLKVLAEAGLLERFREGSWVFHRLARDGGSGTLARALVAMAPEDDPVMALDRGRLAQVKQERAEAAAAYFRRNAADWDRLRSLHADEGELERALLRLLDPGPDDRLLDVGTGTGRMLEVAGRPAGAAVGIDLSPEMLAVARARLDAAGLETCSVRQADMYHLPFADGAFTLATVHQVLHFADDPARAIAEAARVLAPGGRLAVVDLAPHDLEYLRTDHAHRRLGFADPEVAGWFAAAGLDTDTVEALPGDPLTVVLWVGRRRS